MDVLSFFQRLNKEGVKLVLKDGSLSVKSNKKISQELLLEIKSNKSLIIDHLKEYQGGNATTELQQKYQRRGTNKELLEKIKPFDKKDLDKIPLSFSQDRLWFLDQLEGTLAYHIPTIIRLEGALDIPVLEESIKTIVARHEVLRTNILSTNGIGYQDLMSADAWSLDQNKITNEELLTSSLQEYINIPFDLSKDYKLRSCLYSLGNNEYVLACVFHHIASDGWSSGILTNEFVELYSALKQNKTVNLPKLSLQYADYAIWQREYLEGEVLDKQLSYWEEKLKDISTLSLPTDYARPSTQSTVGSNCSLELDEELSLSIKALSNKEGVTLFMFLLSAFKVLLARYSGQEDICVGTPIANRTQSELEEMIGFFVNTLALRSNLTSDLSFKKLLAEVKQTTLKSYDNQLAPFEKVVDRVVKSREMSVSPLFQVMFVLQNTPSNSGVEMEGVVISEYNLDRGTSQFDLTLNASEKESGILLTLEYCTALFNKTTIEQILVHYQELLKDIVNDITQPIGSLSMLTEKEERQLIEVFNDNKLSYPLENTIVDLFKEQVKNTPEAIAVIYEEETLTYKELDERSNQLAHYLQKQGVTPDALIGICLERSLEMIVGILGILKSGGAYVPIDPNYPQDRIRYMLDDAGINLVLSNTSSNKILENKPDLRVVSLDTNWNIIADFSTEKPEELITPNNLAYVIYTSGSTGRPKGVMIEHRNVVNLIASQTEKFSIDSKEVVLQFSNFVFDASVEQIFVSLSNGGKLVLIDKDKIINPEEVLNIIEKEKVTHFHTTPSMLSTLPVQKELKSLKRVVVGGEVCSKELMLLWSEKYTFYNEYGPTETTVTSTVSVYDINTNDKQLNIGKPINNTQAYITDSEMNLVPVGVVGELCLGGRGVARGYLNREELTAEKFINSPFKLGEKLYKTGDLVRWLPDGNIEFVGRSDNQVKIRGYRIELGEIENILSSLDSVSHSCVLAKEDITGNKRLVGYVVCEERLDKEIIQEELKKSLPDYMVPTLWVEVEEMPLTFNGKLDRKALPEPDDAILSTKTYVAPRNETEQVLVTIWQELLGVEKIGVYDSFFELGGHSLLVIQLISSLQKNGYNIAVKDIFSNATIAAISEKIASSDSVYKVPSNGIEIDTDRIVPEMVPLLNFEQEDLDRIVESVAGGVSNIQDIYPLSALQEGIYFHHLMSDKKEGDPYVLPNLISFADEEKRTSFIEALQFVVNRHDVLRTCVLSEGLPQAVQVVLREAKLSVESLTIDSSKNIVSELEHLTSPGNQWMDVSKAPLLSLKTVDNPVDNNYYLVVNQHHLVFDHVALEKVVKEVEAYLLGKEANLPTPVLYREFIGYTLHQQSINDSATYFKGLFESVDEPTYPFELSNIRGNGSDIKESRILLPTELSKNLREFSTHLGMSPAVLFHAAYGLIISKCSNKDYAIFGSLFSGRLQGSLGAADSLGLFINTLPFFAELNGSVLDYVQKVKKQLEELVSYEQTPLSKIQDWSGIANETPLFSALLNFRHSSAPSEVDTNETNDLGINFLGGEERTNYPLVINIDDYGIDFGLTVQVDNTIEPDRVLSYMKTTLTQLLKELKSEKRTSISTLTILPKVE
ncbi:amino acid adenylation domain-containing protein, partial [Tenacibaculum sp. 190524A02b]